MKPWEILKAIDEGKTIQHKIKGVDSAEWITFNWITFNLGGWFIRDFINTRHEWRIKPEPRVFELIRNKSTGTWINPDLHNNREWCLAHPDRYEFIKVTENVS